MIEPLSEHLHLHDAVQSPLLEPCDYLILFVLLHVTVDLVRFEAALLVQFTDLPCVVNRTGNCNDLVMNAAELRRLFNIEGFGDAQAMLKSDWERTLDDVGPFLVPGAGGGLGAVRGARGLGTAGQVGRSGGGRVAGSKFSLISVGRFAKWWPKISELAGDWAQKGAHVKMKGVEIAIRPGAGGTIVLKSVFSKANPAAVKEATSIAAAALREVGYRQYLYNASVRALTNLGQGSDIARARSYEIRQLLRNLIRWGL